MDIDYSKNLVFTENLVKAHLLNKQFQEKIISNNKYTNGLLPQSKLKNIYPFFINQHFSIKYDLSKKMIPYFDYIDVSASFQDKKIKLIQSIKKLLLKENILKEFDISQYSKMISLDYSFVPSYIKSYQKIEVMPLCNQEILLYKTKNKEEQVYSVFEKIVELLNQGVDIRKIKILNTQADDDFQLKKLLKDANIPINCLQSQSIKIYPIYKEIKASLRNLDLDQAKAQIMTYFDKHPQVIKEVIKVINKYPSHLLKNQMSVFIDELDQITINCKSLEKAIEIISLDQMNDLENHYLVMNYIDEYFPKKAIDNDYLNNKQKQMIDYPTTDDINQYRLKLVSHYINSLKHVTLFYPSQLVDQTRLANLSLKRKVKLINYSYASKEISYLKNFDLLNYAIKKELFENYHQDSKDLNLLHQSFKQSYKAYNPQFKGINESDLNILLDKKYTLTGAKLETLNLCPFQYFMTYLLGLNDFADNHYIYFGNKIHKALEGLSESIDYDYVTMINHSNDFPQDIAYKKPLYDQILIDNIKYIHSIVNDFYKQSHYQELITEQALSFKIKESDRFIVKGIIDKVMIDKTNHYYVIIDYKFSKKTFSLDEFNKQRKLQLPFYMYLFEKEFNFKPSGLFFRKTSADREKENQAFDNLLNGVFLNDLDQMQRLDSSGKHITGLRFKKDGLYKSNRSLTLEDFKEMSKKMEAYIYQAAKKIESGDFEIKPILSEEKNNQSISCLYCDFSHICYSKNKYVRMGDGHGLH